VPFGFVLKTTDKGKTWKRVLRKNSRMVWDVSYDKKKDKVYAMTYSPFGSRLLVSNESGDKWKKMYKQEKALFHHLLIQDGLHYVGGRSGKLNRYGVINNSITKTPFEKSGMIWSLIVNNSYSFAPATKGILLYRHLNSEWKQIDTGIPRNMYEAVFIDLDTIYVVGNRQTILRIDLSEIQSNY